MDVSQGQTASKVAHERELARERKAAFWILVLAMALSAIIAMVLTIFLQRH